MPGLFVVEAFATGMAAQAARDAPSFVDLDQAGHGAAWRDTARIAFHRSPTMWVLMYVFSYSVSPAATNDRAEWRLLPTVVFQEFSSEERCRAAKSTLESSLGQAGARLKSGLEDLKSLGKADPSQIIIAYNVECLPK
ncbi:MULTISPECIES: hypothetical protein [Bradyrhizobium]|nr:MULTISPECIES: hypothetical protein [Bradyrhizobium]UFW52328.1 hypothetical protein BaraCB756_15625 [Bradyrhizobium arachidis]